MGLETEDYVFSQPDQELMEKLKIKLSKTGFTVKTGG
jgi:hypothetical protein